MRDGCNDRCETEIEMPAGDARVSDGARASVFFSSRVRHTRFDCDWSSAVCSSDLQLAFFPLVLPPGAGAATERDRDVVRRLRAIAPSPDDPKAGALARLLDGRLGKTIVFVQSRATVHHLMRCLRGHRPAALTGERGWVGSEPAGRGEGLRRFAPRAPGAAPPAP